MAREFNYVCDFCNEVVGGTHKKAEVKANYFQLKGSVLLEDWDTEQDARRYFYLTEHRNDELTFRREKSCFFDWMQMKENMREQTLRDRAMQRAATAYPTDRREGPGYYTQGGYSTR